VSKTLEALRQLPYVAAVDDERRIGNSIIVALVKPYCFVDDRSCGIMGFDTVAEAKKGCAKGKVYVPEGSVPPNQLGSEGTNPCDALPPKAKLIVVTTLSHPAGTRLGVDWYENRSSNFDRKSKEHIREAAEAAGFVEYRGGHPWVTAAGSAWAAQEVAKKVGRG
jgi:hypothetical protein